MPTVSFPTDLELAADVLREQDPDPQRLILWLRGNPEERHQDWQRVSGHLLAPALVHEEVAAIGVRVADFREPLRTELMGRFLRFWGRPAVSEGGRYILPTGGWAETLGSVRDDALLAWSPRGQLPPTRIAELWPHNQGHQQLGPNLILVVGVEPPAPAVAPPEEGGVLADADLQRELDRLSREVRTCSRQGERDRARALAEESLELARQHRGSQHPWTATCLNQLALLYQMEGDLAGAEPLYREALQITCPVLGDNHPNFPTSLNNLALLYLAQGNPGDAEPLLRQALDIRRSCLGDQNQLVATHLNNLALLFHAAGNSAAAEPLLLQAVEVLRTTLGENHPDLAACMENLAALYNAVGNEASAGLLASRARYIRQGAEGQEYSLILDTLNILAEMPGARELPEVVEPTVTESAAIDQAFPAVYYPTTEAAPSSEEATVAAPEPLEPVGEALASALCGVVQEPVVAESATPVLPPPPEPEVEAVSPPVAEPIVAAPPPAPAIQEEPVASALMTEPESEPEQLSEPPPPPESIPVAEPVLPVAVLPEVVSSPKAPPVEEEASAPPIPAEVLAAANLVAEVEDDLGEGMSFDTAEGAPVAAEAAAEQEELVEVAAALAPAAEQQVAEGSDPWTEPLLDPPGPPAPTSPVESFSVPESLLELNEDLGEGLSVEMPDVLDISGTPTALAEDPTVLDPPVEAPPTPVELPPAEPPYVHLPEPTPEAPPQAIPLETHEEPVVGSDEEPAQEAEPTVPAPDEVHSEEPPAPEEVPPPVVTAEVPVAVVAPEAAPLPATVAGIGEELAEALATANLPPENDALDSMALGLLAYEERLPEVVLPPREEVVPAPPEIQQEAKAPAEIPAPPAPPPLVTPVPTGPTPEQMLAEMLNAPGMVVGLSGVPAAAPSPPEPTPPPAPPAPTLPPPVALVRPSVQQAVPSPSPVVPPAPPPRPVMPPAPPSPADLEKVARLESQAATARAAGDLEAAEPLYRQALEIRRSLLGDGHPEVRALCHDLAWVYAGSGRAPEALALFQQAVVGDDQQLGQPCRSPSPGETSTTEPPTNLDFLLSLVAQQLAEVPEAVHSALEMVFRYQAATAQAEALHWSVAPARELCPHGAGLREVAQRLPAGGSLVQLVRLPTLDLQNGAPAGAAHYLAFLLTPETPDRPLLLDLGDAATIDCLVEDFRTRVRGGEGEEPVGPAWHAWLAQEGVPAAGGELRQVVFDPVAQALPSCKQFFIVPAGSLVCLPFAALPTDEGAHLLDSYQFNYLTALHDVFRFAGVAHGEPMPTVVVADPDFDLAPPVLPGSRGGAGRLPGRLHPFRERDTIGARFPRLSGSRRGGKRLAALFGIEPLLDGAVRKARLQALQSPRILHLATHCFFTEDLASETEAGDVPSSRAGLALAGANNPRPLPRGDDGLLSSAEVSALDLLDTELVVLATADTGTADERRGRSVLELQRAFGLTGSAALVMSLWKVTDWHAQELLTEFYDRLLAGEPRGEALRQAQLSLKARYPYQPVYWGAFICQGDPGPLRLPPKGKKSTTGRRPTADGRKPIAGRR